MEMAGVNDSNGLAPGSDGGWWRRSLDPEGGSGGGGVGVAVGGRLKE